MPQFFHVTTSSTLIGLVKTGFGLCSSKTLVSQYGFAPIAGEIAAGGSIGATIDPGIAFAKAGDSYWRFDNLMGSYGKHTWKQKRYASIEAIESAIDTMSQHHFSTMNEVLIQLMRDKQMGDSVDLPEEKFNELCKTIDEKLKEIKQYYLRNFVIPVYFKDTSITGIMANEYRHVFIRALLNTIPLDFLQQSLEQQEAFFATFPQLFKEAMAQSENEAVEIQFSDLFEKISHTECAKPYFPSYAFDTAMILPDRLDFITKCLEMGWEEPDRLVDTKKLREKIMANCEQLTAQVEHFKKVLKGDGIYVLSQSEREHCLKPFPIVFILNDDSKLSPVKYEFRAHGKLKIGEDIQTMATHEENIETLRDFFGHHGIENIRIIPISSLTPPNISAHSMFTPKPPMARTATSPYASNTFN